MSSSAASGAAAEQGGRRSGRTPVIRDLQGGISLAALVAGLIVAAGAGHAEDLVGHRDSYKKSSVGGDGNPGAAGGARSDLNLGSIGSAQAVGPVVDLDTTGGKGGRSDGDHGAFQGGYGGALSFVQQGIVSGSPTPARPGSPGGSEPVRTGRLHLRWAATAAAPLPGLLAVLAFACLLLADLAAAQAPKPPPQPIKVGVHLSPPFVMKQGSRYTGMAIELWETIAAELNLISQYQELPNYGKIVEAVANRSVDVAVANLSITEERAKLVDFTHPWFDAGLRVMVNTKATESFRDVLGDLGGSGYLTVYAWIGAALVLLTVLLTMIDRVFDKDFTRSWGHGLAESFYHVMSVATSGKTTHKRLFGPLGAVIAAIWMVCGVAVVAYVTSSITSVMTAAQLTNRINGFTDLQGKLVGVRAGSVPESYVQSMRIRTKPFDYMDDAAAALRRDDINAIVDDSPVLEYFEHANPELPLDVVGNMFHPDKYGFAFTTGNPLTKPASIAIIRAQESGELERLRTRYFGFRP